MTRSATNRPRKYGPQDRREYIVQDSEVALAAINDTSGNPVFLGRAKAGTTDSQAKWQIRKITYDSNGAVTRVQWPQNDEGNASTEYEFIWDASNANLTITNISQGNPAVVTVSSLADLNDGDQLVILNVSGMTEVNFDGTNIYTAANSAGNTFELQGIDSSLFTAYSSGGSVIYGNVVNLTYS